MEKLYIKVDENNMFVDHPHFEANLRQLYPSHNFDNGAPNGWMEFERVEPPDLGPYEKFNESVGGNIAIAFPHNGLEYAIVDGKYKDVWHVQDMTPAEKLEKQNQVKADWANLLENTDIPELEHYVFDDVTCSYKPAD